MSDTLRLSGAFALAACLALTACVRPVAQPHPDDPPTDAEYASNHVIMREVPAGRGMMCDVWNPGQKKRTTPPSYLIADIGKAGVPRPAASDQRMVRKIQRYVHAEKTLRFVYAAGELMVFDATLGPCPGFAPGYFVLNGRCNEYYMPSSSVDLSIPMTDCVYPPRPWIPHDNARGDASKWLHYERDLQLRP